MPTSGGYLAAGWAAVLNELGPLEADTLDLATAEALNTPAWIKTANKHLGLNSEEASWLTGDQVSRSRVLRGSLIDTRSNSYP